MTHTGMVRQGFDNNKPPAIFKRLKRMYGTPILQETDQALLRIHYQPVELMLRTTEEVQIFLMAHPDGYSKLNDVNLIIYAVIKLSKCGGLYTKDIERWQSKTKTYKNIWENLR